MSKTFEYDVFLSYSSKDKGTVHALAERLKKDGLRVWLDAWEIKPGDSIPLKIQEGLERSHTLVMCMSPAYFHSEWGKLEHYTLLFRDPTNIQRRFIPLLIEHCDLPEIISQFAYIDWQNTSAYEMLLVTCHYIEPGTTDSMELYEVSRQAQKVLKGHFDTIWGVAITPDGRSVVSVSMDNRLKVWNLETGKIQATFRDSTEIVSNVVITFDNKAIFGSERNVLKVWDLKTGECCSELKGHTDSVRGIAITRDNRTIISGSIDKTLKIWDLETGQCRATLKGHTGGVWGVITTPDNKSIISGSIDKTLKIWDLETGQCHATFEGHAGGVRGVAITPDGKTVVSCSWDNTLKIWDLRSGRCRATFEGHFGVVNSVAITPDGKIVVSGSDDKTLKVWDVATGQCHATFKGHTGAIYNVAIAPDGKTVVSASSDNTLRMWQLPCYDALIESTKVARYTNAKVVLVGKTGVGKTGLALRLCENRWEITESTHGMIISRLELKPNWKLSNTEREIWLWDFAGQPDYRLINQLYMDETALGVLVFDPQDENPFEEIGYWEKALQTTNKYNSAKLLVAARCDRGGITISNKRFEQYMEVHKFADFLTTAAKTGEGCDKLMEAIVSHIPWQQLPWTATSQLFKTLRNVIIKLADEKAPLVRLPEMHQRLQLLLPRETFNDSELRAVVGLMQGQGVVQMLDFGNFLLLQPEWINRYASVVVRMAREHTDEMGVISEQKVLEGQLDYKEMNRLAEADEKILLRAMVQTFLDRSLCLRENTLKGTMLVFPSYFRRDKPDPPEHPNVFVTYSFSGRLDEIYATLVVRLSYSDMFKSDQLWKNAADFKTPGGKRLGLAMITKPEGTAEILVYFEVGVSDDLKVMFIKYVHEHLLTRAHDIKRIRHYVCPNPKCGEPVESIRAIAKAIERGTKYIPCQFCLKNIPIFDLIEQKFASSKALVEVRRLEERANINLDKESTELILAGHAHAITIEAGQIYHQYTSSDHGLDGEIEFKNDEGQASGKRIYLQLKSSDSYQERSKREGSEMFAIKDKHCVEYWLSLSHPTMLVIRTSSGKILWMNITNYLRKHGKDKKEILFDGEPFTALNVINMRDKLLNKDG